MKILLGRLSNLWLYTTVLLLLANLGYLSHNVFAWSFTLAFFLFTPGYLLLRRLHQTAHFSWASLSLSIGLSVSLITISGLLLNSLSAVGLQHPLQTHYIFIVLDLVTLGLLSVNKPQKITFQLPKFSLSTEESIFGFLFLLLPLLSIGGAMRLNNGASNVLTMIMMGLIGSLFIVLMLRPELRKIYSFGLFMTAISLLFCNSLRGWSVTGHDIHHEFSVFSAVFNNEYWQSRTNLGDPYNACLSITILPTIFAKISHIDPIYVYKVVFQLIFASMLPALFAFARKFSSDKKALIGIFAFMTFPTFTNDLPFLNRQEIAFAYFILILYVNFSAMASRTKTFLTALLMLSVIISHYSTSYATVSLLLVALIVYKILMRLWKNVEPFRIPLLRPPIIIMALLATFVWNAQITASSSNLSNTLEKTFTGIFAKNSESSNFEHYNLLAKSAAKTPAQQLKIQTQGLHLPAIYSAPAQIPITRLGKVISKFISVSKLNTMIHTLIAKVLQLLVTLGTIVMILRYRKQQKTLSSRDIYYLSFCISCIIALIIFTFFPQLSIGYDVTRLFQQSMMFLWLPVLLASDLIFKKFGKYTAAVSAAMLVFLYFNLAGFMPQLTGGFLPQLSLNNSGLYYDYFYTHTSDITGANWLTKNKISYLGVFMDTNSSAPPLSYSPETGLITGYPKGYYYLDYMNTGTHRYRTFISSGFVEYTDFAITRGKDLIYSNGDSSIYFGGHPVY